MNLTGWAHARGIHVHAACWWYREGTLLVPVAKAGRVVLVVSETARVAAGRTGGSGLYARVSWHDQRSGLGGRVARLSACVAGAGLSVARVEAEAGSEADWSRAKVRGSRAKVRRLVSDPAVTVVVAGDRGRPGRTDTELAAAVLCARNRRLVLPGNSEVTGDLVGGMVEVVAWFYAGLCGSQPTRDRALKALGCVQQDIGARAVKLQTSGGGV